MYTVLGCKITNPAMVDAIAKQMERAHGPAEVEKSAEVRRPTEQAMNKTERLYGEKLDRMKAAGTVTWWGFNKIRLRIADGAKAAYFRPDFLILFADGHFEFHETKGFEREAALVRLKVAAGMFPIPFFLVKRVRGEWTFERFGGAA